jgi:hypothetical protein
MTAASGQARPTENPIVAAIELHSIDVIPDAERHGTILHVKGR